MRYLRKKGIAMASDESSRRQFVKKLLLGATLAPLANAALTTGQAAERPLLNPNDPEAKKLNYIEDADTAKDLAKGNNCRNCALYEGTYESTQAPCQLFPGKDVKVIGWCSGWAPQL